MRNYLGKKNAQTTLGRVAVRMLGISAIMLFVTAFMVMNFTVMAAPHGAEAAECTATGGISGVVFYDYNNNGVQDANEPGIEGVTVSGFISSPNGSQTAGTACESRADGSYNFAQTQFPVRVEFTLPASLQSYLKASGAGASTVQFVNAPSTAVNVGYHDPADYCQNNVEIGAACFSYGERSDAGTPQHAVLSFDYDSPQPAGAGTDVRLALPVQTTRGERADVGSVLGLAFHGQSEDLFAAAWVKRHVDLGPSGAGAIYRIDTATNSTSLLFDLNTLAGSPAGTVNNRPDPALPIWGGGQPHLFYDTDAFVKAGTAGLGDIDLSPDDKTLFAVNMADKQLYMLAIPNNPAVAVTPADVTAVAIPNTCSNGADARPMALGYNNGKMYVGSVCSAQSIVETQVTNHVTLTNDIDFVNSADFTQLFETTFFAEVFEFDIAAGAFNPTPVLNVPLNYDRGCIFLISVTAGRGANVDCRGDASGVQNANWRPWQSDPAEVYDPTKVSGTSAAANGWPVEYPQPILADIEFDGEDMILGLRDIHGDRSGHNMGYPNTAAPAPGYTAITQTFRGAGFGDTLRACWNTATSAWELESNGNCGALTTVGAGQGEGPGSGEYYWNETSPGGANNIAANSWISGTAPDTTSMGHSESSMGMLLQLQGQPQVVAPAIEVSEFYDAGLMWLNNQTGASDKRVKLYDAPFPFNNATPLPRTGDGLAAASANGVGDIEAFCAAAPIEIGNLIWLDDNKNGVQDPGEAGAAGVAVQLFAETDLVNAIATATTDVNGNYRFSSGPGINTASSIYNLSGIQPEADYRIVIVQNQPGTPIDGLFPALGNTPSGANSDVRDSDAISVTRGGTQLVDISLTTGVIGDNDHSFDAGFVDTPVEAVFRDWGDLPDTFDTTSAINGAHHILVDGLHLGACVDGEVDGGPSAQANGDDNNITISTLGGSGTCASPTDDEDGIFFRTFAPDDAGVAVCTGIDVIISAFVPVGLGGDGQLNAWADLNTNGTFEANEQFVTNNTINGALVDSTTPLNFLAPASGAPLNTVQAVSGLRIPCDQGLVGSNIGFRFRFTAGTGVGGDMPAGAATNGEVEDYILPVYGWDFGDSIESTDASNSSAYQTSVPASLLGNYKDTLDATTLEGGARHIVVPGGVRLGTSVATELNAEVATDPSSTNTGGDGSGEEDGWAYQDAASLLTSRWDKNQDGFINVNVSQVDPVNGACIYGFIDWEGDGFETGHTSIGLTYTQSDGEVTVVFPASAERDDFFNGAGTLRGAYVRFRVIDGSGVEAECDSKVPGTDNYAFLQGNATGYACNGEVEDYYINFTPLAVTMQEFDASQSRQTSTILLIAMSALLAATAVAFAASRRNRAG